MHVVCTGDKNLCVLKHLIGVSCSYSDSVIVGKVCLDDEFTFNREIGVQLGVMAIPNVVIFNHGKMVGKRIVGPQEQAVYREAINKILNL